MNYENIFKDIPDINKVSGSGLHMYYFMYYSKSGKAIPDILKHFEKAERNRKSARYSYDLQLPQPKYPMTVAGTHYCYSSVPSFFKTFYSKYKTYSRHQSTLFS